MLSAGINPITALMNLENGQLAENEAGKKLVKRAIDEAVRVATARGISLPYGSHEAFKMAEDVIFLTLYPSINSL